MSDDEDANVARFAHNHPEHVRRGLAASDPARAPAGLGARLHAVVVKLIGRYGDGEASPWELGELLGETDYARAAEVLGELSTGVGPAIWCSCGAMVHGERVPRGEFTTPAGRRVH